MATRIPHENPEKDFERFRPYLKMMVRLQIGAPLLSKIDPSDLVQQTLLDAHQSRHRLRGASDGEQAAWLRQILARNLADEVRRYSRWKRNAAIEKSIHAKLNDTSLVIERWLASQEDSPSDHAIRNERLLHLAAALTVLPEDQRRAVELYHLQGKSSTEVAQLLNRTEAAVAGLLRRAMQKLRSLLRDSDED